LILSTRKGLWLTQLNSLTTTTTTTTTTTATPTNAANNDGNNNNNNNSGNNNNAITTAATPTPNQTKYVYMLVRILTPIQSIRPVLYTPWLSSTWLVTPRTRGLPGQDRQLLPGQIVAFT
jgi:hypothetical protein